MSKGKKRSNVETLFRGVLVTLGIYFVGVLLISLLLMEGTLPEGAAFSAMAMFCFLAVLAGGLLTKYVSWGAFAGSFAVAAVFAGVLFMLALGFGEGITWKGQGGALLLCAMGAGILSGLIGKRHRPRKKRK